MTSRAAVSRHLRVATVAMVGVVVLTVVALGLVLLSITDPGNTSAPAYLPLALSATAALLIVCGTSIVLRRVDVQLVRGFPWMVGILSFLVSFIPWWGLAGGNPDLGTLIYRGLRVPQGIMQFWDLTLVMKSVDCARWGFDIYLDNNGCMQDASIYAPGMVWLRYIPFEFFSEAHVQPLGVGMIIISSLALAWLARQTRGIGQIVLAIAAVGGPWLLLLERGNIDAVVLWSAVIAVVVVRRWDRLWAWAAIAALLWLMGTWKYYPFAMGAMLLPALRLRHGWTVIVGFLSAAIGYVILTWDNFRFSAGSNSAMIEFGDFVVLGRVPVVARMLGTTVGSSGIQIGDVTLGLLTISAVIWGFALGGARGRVPVWTSMLAVGGSLLYVASVLVAGFGYGYKATFLLLAVPLVSSLVSSKNRLMVGSGVAALLLVGMDSVVVWNTVLATIAGIIAAGFSLGLGGSVLIQSVRQKRHARP